jgi:predicted Ser/Thr protein kinase
VTERQAIWAQAASLFDELAQHPSGERERIMAERTIPGPVRRWLDELLEAHDADRSMIIDRRIDDLARGLADKADAPTIEDPSGQRFGPWRARRTVGRGGMGLVLEGERADGRFEMRVAIKLLAPEALGASAQSLIEQEVRTLARLEHPGIARLVDGGVRDDGVAWLAMEFVDGESIDAWCERQKPGIEQRLALFRQVAEAVSFCHRALVAHGDIKPANILVDEYGRARLLDFGIAARMTESGSEASAGGTRSWCSPGYASPERLAGQPPSIEDDVFALGAVLFRFLNGRGIRSAPEQTRLLSGRALDRPGCVSLRRRGSRRRRQPGAGGRPGCALSKRRGASGRSRALGARLSGRRPRRRHPVSLPALAGPPPQPGGGRRRGGPGAAGGHRAGVVAGRPRPPGRRTRRAQRALGRGRAGAG